MMFSTLAVDPCINTDIIDNNGGTNELVLEQNKAEITAREGSNHFSDFFCVLTTVALLSISFWATSWPLQQCSTEIQPATDGDYLDLPFNY